jgi:hypothetical protein
MISQPREALLHLQTVATLDVAAASGIALRADKLYVIADDQLELAVYSLAGVRIGSIPLQGGALPQDAAARKRVKPDYEALLSLPDGSLLALGSGSTARRMQGALIQFGACGVSVEPIDLSDLYERLRSDLPLLNIEGATVWGGELYLASRGNGPDRDNALIRLDLARASQALSQLRALPGDLVRGIQRVRLGELSDVPLSLTDLTVFNQQLLFAATAEASASTYDDGACTGSVLGSLTPDGQTRDVIAMSPRLKIEGLCAQSGEPQSRLWLVADADDPQVHAPLMAADWPAP